jgi:signal transduction histidine kinase
MSAATFTLRQPTGLDPPERGRDASGSFVRALGDRVIVAFSGADDVRSGMTRVVAMLCRDGVERVEWWSPTGDGALQLEVADGEGQGERTTVPLGPAGVLVVVGDHWGSQLSEAVAGLAPILRRRWTEEQLAVETVRLAQRNEALEDFAALVAHELKTPLHAALLGEDPLVEVERALDLVDALLEVSRPALSSTAAWQAECLDEALRDLVSIEAEVTADFPVALPLPPTVVRVLIRNLVANAVAAGARYIRVGTHASAECSRLVVDDDGVGLAAADRYDGGSGIGLGLCRRLAGRFGGSLELAPLATGGTRATLIVERSEP